MDIIKHMCSVVPDGLTGESIAHGLTFAFIAVIEEGITSADFTRSEIDVMWPRLVGCPGCGSLPTAEHIIAISELVTMLEPFRPTELWDSITNSAGEEYSKLTRNLVTLPTGYTAGADSITNSADDDERYSTSVMNIAALPIGVSDGFRKVSDKVNSILRFAKDVYPRYYRIEKDPDDILLKVFIGEDGKKKYHKVSRRLDDGEPYHA